MKIGCRRLIFQEIQAGNDSAHSICGTRDATEIDDVFQEMMSFLSWTGFTCFLRMRMLSISTATENAMAK